LGRPPDWAYELAFSALVGGLIGSRVDYILQNLDTVGDDLLGALFSGSGLVWFGGVVGGAAGVLIWARFRGFLGPTLLDVAAPALALGYAIGRVGCQLSGDGDYGVASDLPWAMAYPDGTVPNTEEVHPAPVYETLAMGLVALVLWHLRDRFRPGTLFGLYLVLSGLERLLIEVIRRNESVVAGLTLAQLVSIVLIVAGVAVVARPGALSPARA
jgi:phosphatidylglycerol:prolipoprotein diacylglycerol transferase